MARGKGKRNQPSQNQQENENPDESFEDNFEIISNKLDVLSENHLKLANGLEEKMKTLSEKNSKISKDVEQLKDVIIKNLVESNKKMQKTIETLQKKVEKLEHREKTTKIYIEKQNQYGRRNNIEISGIKNEVADEELEDKVIEILDKIDVKVTKEDFEACHRLPPTRNNKNKKTIVRFVNRKKAEKSIENKKKLERVDLIKLKLDKTPLYISENLNDHYRELAWMCRKLKREGLIFSYKYQNETFIVKAKENSDTKIKISHRDHLLKYYDDFFNFEEEE